MLTLGDYATALSFEERALALRERVLGPDHPDTAHSLSGFGVLRLAMGYRCV